MRPPLDCIPARAYPRAAMRIATNLATIRPTLRPGVTLVAMSKTKPVEDLREAVAAGQIDLGENYAQELRDKFDQVPGARWHFCGALQRNKVKYVVGRCALVHDVDSVELAEELGKRSGARTQDILVGVNFGEEQKSGVPASAALALCKAIMAVPGVSLRGLMCLPPWQEDPEACAPYFEELAALAATGRAQELPLDFLSMGMSHDYTVAMRYGATHVRVGTAIFGERTKKV